MATLDTSPSRRARTGRCYWFTGLSGAGKTTMANAFCDVLTTRGNIVVVLDGDVLRQGMNRDLGFSRADRGENVRRIAEIASLMVDAGLIVLVAAIAPYRADRDAVQALFGKRPYFEVYVAADPSTCEARDPKGLYRQARAGLLPGLTGLDDPYEAPHAPALRLDTSHCDLAHCLGLLIHHDQAQPGVSL